MSVLIDVLVRSSLILGLGLLATAALRRQPAAVRHWLLAAARRRSASLAASAVWAASSSASNRMIRARRLPSGPASASSMRAWSSACLASSASRSAICLRRVPIRLLIVPDCDRA